MTGLEPATLGVTGRYSNQLSYTRAFYAAAPLGRRASRGASDSCQRYFRPIFRTFFNGTLSICFPILFYHFGSPNGDGEAKAEWCAFDARVRCFRSCNEKRALFSRQAVQPAYMGQFNRSACPPPPDDKKNSRRSGSFTIRWDDQSTKISAGFSKSFLSAWTKLAASQPSTTL